MGARVITEISSFNLQFHSHKLSTQDRKLEQMRDRRRKRPQSLSEYIGMCTKIVKAGQPAVLIKETKRSIIILSDQILMNTIEIKNCGEIPQELLGLNLDYEQLVCSLMQIAEALMMGQQQETVRPYLYYAKCLLDEGLKYIVRMPLSAAVVDSDHLILNLLKIFLKNSGVQSQYQVSMPDETNIFPDIFQSFDLTIDPFNFLEAITTVSPNNLKALVSTIQLALTKKQFYDCSSECLVFGCIECFKQMFHMVVPYNRQVMPLSPQKLQNMKNKFKQLMEQISSL